MIITPITQFKTCYTCLHALEIRTEENCNPPLGEMFIACAKFPRSIVHVDSITDCEAFKNVFKHFTQPGKEQ